MSDIIIAYNSQPKNISKQNEIFDHTGIPESFAN